MYRINVFGQATALQSRNQQTMLGVALDSFELCLILNSVLVFGASLRSPKVRHESQLL